MIRKLVFILAAFLVFLLAVGVLLSFFLGGRVEHRVAEYARNYGTYSTVRVAPLRGRVTVKPFDWADARRGLGIKASALTLRIGPWEMAGILLGMRDTTFHEFSFDLDRAIVSVPANLFGPETVHITAVSATMYGRFNLLPDRSVEFLSDLAGVQAELDHVNIPDVTRFSGISVEANASSNRPDRFRSGGTVRIHGRSGTGSIPFPPLMSSFSPGEDLILEASWEETQERSQAVVLSLDMRDVRVMPEVRLLRELDARRDGLSRTIPPDGLYVSRFFLTGEAVSQEITVSQFELQGPDIAAHGEGTIGVAENYVPAHLEGRLDVEQLADTWRPTAVSLLYYATSGMVPPRDSPYTVWIESAPETERGWNARITSE